MMIQTEEKRLSDKEWFREVYEKHRQKIYNFIASMTNDRDLSDDLTQEVFKTLWIKIEQVRDKRHVGGWLAKTALNKTLSEEKKAWHHREMELYEDAAFAAEPDQEIAFLECLPPDMEEEDKKLLLYRIFYQYKFREVGKLLGRSPAAVQMRFYRLRKDLKKMLEESL